MMVAVQEGELGELGDLRKLEAKEGVQIKGGHQVNLVPDFFPTKRKLRAEGERLHSSSRR